MTLPRLFAGRRVYILGGGPSLTLEIADRLRGLHVVVVNSTARLAPWAEVLFFGDWRWFADNRPIVDPWPGLAVTTCTRAARTLPRLHLVGPPEVATGLTSGHSALDVAAAMGAAEIVLLGFDCRTVAGRSHHHDDYRVQAPESLYRERILPMWAGWGERMRQKGVAVINATPGSALDEFPRADLGELTAH